MGRRIGLAGLVLDFHGFACIARLVLLEGLVSLFCWIEDCPAGSDTLDAQERSADYLKVMTFNVGAGKNEEVENVINCGSKTIGISERVE